MNDAFITYRRLDGEVAARRLRRRLLDYRFPRSLRKKLPFQPLTIYLDRLYERATNDFFEGTIVPALRESRHLIVVQTPATLRPRSDGEKNWVVREIEIFRGFPQRDQISVALAAGSVDDPLPADLHKTLPNIERVDIRRLRPLGFGARDQVLTFVAALHNVPPELMPELRREDAKRRAAIAWTIAIFALAALAVLALLLWWALDSRAEALRAQKATQHELAAAHFRAAAKRDPPSEALAHAAKAVSLDPEYDAARTLLIGLLMDRNWPLPRLDLSHSSSVIEVAFSPDDSRLVTRTDREVFLWRASDGKPIGSPMGMSAHIYEISFSPDWRTLLIATTEGWAAWDLPSGRALPIGGRIGQTITARYLGPHFILLEDGEGPPRLCDGATGRRCAVMPPLLGGVTCGPRGIQLRDGHPAVVDLPTGRTLGKPMLIAGALERAAFSPDCRWIATVTSDATKKGRHPLALWHGDGSPAHRLQDVGSITAMELSPDGSRMVTISEDRRVRVWSTLVGTRLAEVAYESRIEAAHFRDASLVVTASAQGAQIFDPEIAGRAPDSAEPRYLPMLHAQEVTAAAFSHDGAWLLTGSADATARLWDVRVGTAKSLPLPSSGTSAIGFSADGRRVAVSDGDTTAVFDAATGQAVAPAFSHPSARYVVFDRGLRHCLLVTNDETATVRELPSGGLIGPAIKHGGTVEEATFDESGTYAATAAVDGVRLWTIASAAAPRWLRSPASDGALSVRFVPASRTLTAGWQTGHLSVITPETETALDVQSVGSVTGIHFASEDGELVLLGNMAARLWSLRKRTPVGPLLLPNGKYSVGAADLNADGNLAATASESRVFLWNARSGALRIDPLPHSSTVEWLAFTSRGERLVTAAEDGVRLWDVASGLVLKQHPLSPRFSHTLAAAADGSRIAAAAEITELFDVVNGSAKEAPLLAAVAEAVGGFRVNASGALEPVLPRGKILQRARATVASLPAAGDSSAGFLRWFLADRATRPPSPSQHQE